MDGLWVAAAEIHHIGNKYYLAGTWSDHGHLIEYVPRRYNVPRNQTQLLVADSPEGPFKPLVADHEFCLGPEDWDIIDGTLYTENDTTYLVFVHEWTQLIDGTMDYMPLSKDLTHRTAEPTTIFRASEAAWSKEMNSIGEATFGLKMPGWVTDGPQMFRTKTGKLGMLWSSWGEHRYAQGVAYSDIRQVSEVHGYRNKKLSKETIPVMVCCLLHSKGSVYLLFTMQKKKDLANHNFMR